MLLAAAAVMIGQVCANPADLTSPARRKYEARYTFASPATLKAKREVNHALGEIERGKVRYRRVEQLTGVPWFIVGVIHYLESDCNFKAHLHNGDPLRRRTIHSPRGRPLTRHWTWESSAADAIRFNCLDRWTDWSIAGTLWIVEQYNGPGYMKRGVPSPYIWGGTHYYRRGKFTRDGHFNPRAVSHQTGAAVLLRAMSQRGLIDFPQAAKPPERIQQECPAAVLPHSLP